MNPKFPNDVYVERMTAIAKPNHDNGDHRGGAASSLCLPSSTDPKNNAMTAAQLTLQQQLPGR